MQAKTILSFVLSIACVAAAATAGCASTEESGPRKSMKGEACQTTNDCTDGLSCVPRSGSSGGVCVRGEFKIAQTAKECAVIECTDAASCCPAPSPSCPTYLQQCNNGSQSYCDLYNQNCKCDASKYKCENGACKAQCRTATDCGGTGWTCDAGKCVQCTEDSQCSSVGTGYVCQKNQCVPPCTNDTECPAFNKCTDGRCTESGCESNRECVAATKNVEAFCKDSKCVVPCATDLECGNPQDYKFYSCIDRQCVYVGCESSKECQLYLGSGTSTGGKKREVVCRDRKTN